MDDELGIYDDLEEFQQVEEKKSKELEVWEQKYKDAQIEIANLQGQVKELNKQVKIMESNFQSLLDTAKAEIKRKDTTIAQLRQEKDDICFRRIRPTGRDTREAIPGAERISSASTSIKQPATDRNIALSNERNNKHVNKSSERRPSRERGRRRSKSPPRGNSKHRDHRRESRDRDHARRSDRDRDREWRRSRDRTVRGRRSRSRSHHRSNKSSDKRRRSRSRAELEKPTSKKCKASMDEELFGFSPCGSTSTTTSVETMTQLFEKASPGTPKELHTPQHQRQEQKEFNEPVKDCDNVNHPNVDSYCIPIEIQKNNCSLSNDNDGGYDKILGKESSSATQSTLADDPSENKEILEETMQTLHATDTLQNEAKLSKELIPRIGVGNDDTLSHELDIANVVDKKMNIKNERSEKDKTKYEWKYEWKRFENETELNAIEETSPICEKATLPESRNTIDEAVNTEPEPILEKTNPSSELEELENIPRADIVRKVQDYNETVKIPGLELIDNSDFIESENIVPQEEFTFEKETIAVVTELTSRLNKEGKKIGNIENLDISVLIENSLNEQTIVSREDKILEASECIDFKETAVAVDSDGEKSILSTNCIGTQSPINDELATQKLPDCITKVLVNENESEENRGEQPMDLDDQVQTVWITPKQCNLNPISPTEPHMNKDCKEEQNNINAADDNNALVNQTKQEEEVEISELEDEPRIENINDCKIVKEEPKIDISKYNFQPIKDTKHDSHNTDNSDTLQVDRNDKSIELKNVNNVLEFPGKKNETLSFDIAYVQPDSTKTDRQSAETEIELALEKLHHSGNTSGHFDDSAVTSTSTKLQKSPCFDLIQILSKTPQKIASDNLATTIKSAVVPIEEITEQKEAILTSELHVEAITPHKGGDLNDSLTTTVTKRCSLGHSEYQFEQINDEVVLHVKRRGRKRRLHNN